MPIITDKKKFLMLNCDICPHQCKAKRGTENYGICKCNTKIMISSFGPHFGEEPELVGITGSGTIFFSGCNLLCIFCQNYNISHSISGEKISDEECAEIMIQLENLGCININLVSPTPYSINLKHSIEIAKIKGLKIPVIWNSNGYERVATLKQLEGIIDIYMPDLKFFHNLTSKKYTKSDNYFKFASQAILEMYRQVGDLTITNGRAKRGLIIRHLIMPNHIDDVYRIIDYVSEYIGSQTYLNLMDQYYPAYKSNLHFEINRRITSDEYNLCIKYAKNKGFHIPDYIYK